MENIFLKQNDFFCIFIFVMIFNLKCQKRGIIIHKYPPKPSTTGTKNLLIPFIKFNHQFFRNFCKSYYFVFLLLFNSSNFLLLMAFLGLWIPINQELKYDDSVEQSGAEHQSLEKLNCLISTKLKINKYSTINIMSSGTSTKIVKVLAMHPPQLTKVVRNDNCPVLLFLKFSKIWGILAQYTKKIWFFLSQNFT